MKNKAYLLIFALSAMLFTSCGALKKSGTTLPDDTTGQTSSVTEDPYNAILATLGEWQTLQTGGNIKLNAGSSFSSSVQVRMVRDQAIYISLRPVLGIEVGKLLITADSIYAVDKVHKRYIAEKVSILTLGIPVTVRDVQDIFLGRPFIIGKGTLAAEHKGEVTATIDGGNIMLSPVGQYKGYGYAFTFDKSRRITSLSITPQGSTTAAYQVKYSDVKKTEAGNIAHGIDVNATVEKKKIAFSLDYKNIEWNGNVKIDRSLPNGYTRMKASELLSLFSN